MWQFVQRIPAGDSIPALIAAGAVCDIATQNGSREMAVEDFVVGVGRNALSDGEFLLLLRGGRWN